MPASAVACGSSWRLRCDRSTTTPAATCCWATGVLFFSSACLTVLCWVCSVWRLGAGFGGACRDGGGGAGGARAGGARGRKALETKLESIGESGSVDSWHDGYAAAVKAEGAGLRKSISFYL